MYYSATNIKICLPFAAVGRDLKKRTVLCCLRSIRIGTLNTDTVPRGHMNVLGKI